MAFDWNVFRILADVCHTLSKCILIWAIHSNRSAEGVSLITQIFYLVVFCSRYFFLPLWSSSDPATFHKIWNVTLKLFYTTSSVYTLFIMTRVFARTREREKAWKIGIVSLVCALALAPFTMMVFRGKSLWSFSECAWIFSIQLESTCVLPQLLLLRQTTVPTVLDSFYLVTLGSYRGFYLLNWTVIAVTNQDFDPISVIFGLIQTALYVDFAWVYWTRQRVKLRGGTVVDSDDLSKGWLVKRFIGQRGSSEEEVIDESTPTLGRNGSGNGAVGRAVTRNARSWGSKGISVSADVGVHDVERGEGEAALADPDEFRDEEDMPDHRPIETHGVGVGNGTEWRDDERP